jgi:hypothetical protein
MSAVVRETERKYDVDDSLLLPSLTGIAGTVVAEPDEQVLDAVYSTPSRWIWPAPM